MKWNKINESNEDVHEIKISASSEVLYALLRDLMDEKAKWGGLANGGDANDMDMLIKQIRQQLKQLNIKKPRRF